MGNPASWRQYYSEKVGWPDEFDCRIAKRVAAYLSSRDPARQACLIAEADGKPVGRVMLTTDNDTAEKLRVMPPAAEAGKGDRSPPRNISASASKEYRLPDS